MNKALIPTNNDEDGCESERHTKLPWTVYLSTFVARSVWSLSSRSYGIRRLLSRPSLKNWDSPQLRYSLFGSILSIGAMFGGISSGPIADFVGRKWAMALYSSICIAGWLGIYFAQGVVSLDLGRPAGGFGIGAFSYVVPVYIAETAPMQLRGVLTSFNQLLLSVGVASSYMLGLVLPWRVLALAGVLPCVVQLLGLLIIPESPRWQARTGKHKEFMESLQKLRPKHADISCEATEIQVLVNMFVLPLVVKVGRKPLTMIFPLNVKGTGGSIATLVNWFCSWAVSYTFNMLTSWSSYVNALAFIFVMKAIPETKRRTLEQIQSEINV